MGDLLMSQNILKGYRDALTGEIWMGDLITPTNDFLVLTKRDGSWQIFHTVTGRPFLKVRFTDKEVAKTFGDLIHRWYGEYLWIWEDKEWCGKDIPRLVQYTIPKGTYIHDAIRWMETQDYIQDLKCLEEAM
jgi:hypothetical protein